jgi:hypothetical protein
MFKNNEGTNPLYHNTFLEIEEFWKKVSESTKDKINTAASSLLRLIFMRFGVPVGEVRKQNVYRKLRNDGVLTLLCLMKLLVLSIQH